MGIFNFASKLAKAEEYFNKLKPVVEELRQRAELAGDPTHLIQLVDKFEADLAAAKVELAENECPSDDILVPVLQGFETAVSLFGDEVRVIMDRFGVELPPEAPKAAKPPKAGK